MGWLCPFPPSLRAPFFFREAVATPVIPAYIELMDTLNDTHGATGFEEILADFELLDDWEDRYRYVIELGRKLDPLPEAERSAANKVQGCVSQVWLSTIVHPDGNMPRLTFIGDSDAHIVRGLIAILFALYSGKTAEGNPGHRRQRLARPAAFERASHAAALKRPHGHGEADQARRRAGARQSRAG